LSHEAVPLIGCNQLRANSLVTASFRAVTKDYGPLHDVHLLNAHHLKVAEVPDFLAGVSQDLELKIKILRILNITGSLLSDRRSWPDVCV
jgi:hypothetical protein